MNWIIFGIVMVWLGIISLFDIRKNEIPHPAWVVIPLILACLYCVEQGGWSLVLMTAAVSMASERKWFATFLKMDEVRMLLSWTPLLFLGLYFAVQENPIAAMAILGFWLAWELKCWGGADAVAAITLLLIYPEINYVLSFFVVHLLVLTVLWTVSFFAGKRLRPHHIPGLPLLIPCLLLVNLF